MARRRQRQREGLFEELFEVTAKLPWWAGVVIAAVAYLWLHHYPVMEVGATASRGFLIQDGEKQ